MSLATYAFKNVGKLIVSENTHSLDWKFRELFTFFDLKQSFIFLSPCFSVKNTSLRIALQSTDAFVSLQVVESNDTTCLTEIIHKKGFKEADGSEQLFNQNTGDVSLWPATTLRFYDSEGYVTIFVEFVEAGISLERETSLSSQDPVNSNHVSRSCNVCGHAGIRGQDILVKKFKELYVNELHHDFTLHVGEKNYKAHKAILAVHSEVFAKMLQHDTTVKETNEVTIEDCDPDAFKEFLLYLYSGQVDTLSDGNVITLYKIADKYRTKDLKERCVDYMKSNLAVGTFCDFIELASNRSENELLEVSKLFFVNNAKELMSSTNWDVFWNRNVALARELYLMLVLGT